VHDFRKSIMGDLSCELVSSDIDLTAAFDVRRQVFVGEQGISEELVFDGKDRDALHMVVKDGGTVIGTARIMLLDGAQAKLERMAVSSSYRRRGIGSAIVSFLKDELSKRQVKQLVLHAQQDAVDFYRTCGFEEAGSPFWEAGIKHMKMKRRLEKNRNNF
jgi:predicted GNAT family N-acyltransferase